MHKIAPALTHLATPVDELELLDGNPRKGDVDAVARSYETFGQRKPIVVQRGTRQVTAGNHQLLAARQLGWDKIAVVWTDDDPLTAKAYALADNRTAELGGYDQDLLVDLMDDVVDDEVLFGATGYTPEDLTIFKMGLAGAEDDTGSGAPAPPGNPRSMLGDVWTLGEHRLVVGDAADAGVWERLMGTDERIDLVFTDPPYGVSYVGGTADAMTIENDSLTGDDLDAFLRDRLGMALSTCNAGAPWFVCAPAGPGFLPFATALTFLGVWDSTIAWCKDQFVMGRSTFHYQHESIFYGAAGEDPPPELGAGLVWRIDRPKQSRDHPTMKPLELVAVALDAVGSPGDLVCDPFGGSGSTLIAAHQAGMVARTIELDPAYADVICRRFQELTGILPVDATGDSHDFTVPR